MQASFSWDYPAPFTIEVQAEASDIDGLQHTNNAVYLRWCEAAGWAHSESLGLSLCDYQQLNRAMAIRRGEYDYLLPALLGQRCTLATWLVGSDGKLSMQRRFQLIRHNDQAVLLRAQWDLVCIELSSGRPKRMPPEFLNAYQPAVVTQASML